MSSRSELPENWSNANPEQIRVKYAVAIKKIHGWIDSGELVARNLATSTRTRPRWCVLREDWDRFLDARASRPAVSTAAKPRSKRSATTVESFV